MFALGQQRAVDWTSTGKRRIFAYLRPEVPGCEALLEALDAGDAEVLCAVAGLTPAWPARFEPGAVGMLSRGGEGFRATLRGARPLSGSSRCCSRC